jgi:hypothetical protein
MSWRFLAIAAACTTVTLPALAGPGPNPGLSGQPGLPGPFPQKSVGAPGSIAGAGLPFLLLAGGYVLVRRYRNQSKAEKRLP